MTNDPESKRPDVSKDILDSYLGRNISQTTFENSMSEFKDNNIDFFKAHEEGHPKSLLSASEEVEGILVRMKRFDAWAAFRRSVDMQVSKTKKIKLAICLAIGRYVPLVDGVRGIWTTQYAAFVYLCHAINEKQRLEAKKQNRSFIPIKRYLQDPAFDVRTKYLLRRIRRTDDPDENMILEYPKATNMIDDSSLVYAIHIVPSMWKEILKRDEQHCPRFPQLLITNDVRGEAGGYDCVLADKYIEESCLEEFPSPEYIEMRVVLDKFWKMYIETPFPAVPVHYGVFQGIAIYQQNMDGPGSAMNGDHA